MFISYSHAEYYEDVQWLADVLRSKGLDVYYDRRLIEPGMPLQESIDQAIRNAHIFVPIFGKDYLKSPWCMYELQLAASAGTRVAPVTVEDRTSIPRDVTQFLRKHLDEPLYLDMRARHAPKKAQQFAANLAA